MRAATARVLGRAAAVAVLAAPVTVLGGCSSAVDVAPAPDAADPRCAAVVAALPAAVAGLDQREVTAQGAAAWGDPVVVLRCGVRPPGPTTVLCTHLESPDGTAVDWLTPDPEHGRVVWTTYGRDPAVALSMPADGDITSAAPLDVADAVAALPQVRDCPAS